MYQPLTKGNILPFSDRTLSESCNWYVQFCTVFLLSVPTWFGKFVFSMLLSKGVIFQICHHVLNNNNGKSHQLFIWEPLTYKTICFNFEIRHWCLTAIQIHILGVDKSDIHTT